MNELANSINKPNSEEETISIASALFGPSVSVVSPSATG